MVTIDTKMKGISEASLDRFVRQARRAAHVRGQVHVLVVSDRRMQSLNWRFRGQKKPTDVLSFPAMPEVAHDCAGDIVISANIAAANARRLLHSLAQELKVLILHGVLHLSGLDHESDNGEMARKEQRLRNQLGLKDGLIERNRSARRAPRSTTRSSTRNAARETRHSRRSRA